MERIHVRPRAGLIVRDPMTRRPIPPEGIEVELTPFWFRRLQDHDVERVEPAPTPEE